MSDTLLETVAAAPGGLPDTTAPSGRQWGPAWWIARRLLLGVAVLLAVSIIIFAATQALPGDAARAILGPTATPARVAVLRHQLGLDRPLINQYWSWLTGALHFDFGQSLAARQPVSSVIGWRIENTLSLLFQSGFSGRAELGLTGDDDLRVKVSADGGTWREALRIDRSTGGLDLAAVEASAAVAATVDLGALPGLKVALTGTGTITSFGTGANRVRLLRFTGAATLTHNAASLVLPGGVTLVTAAGDTVAEAQAAAYRAVDAIDFPTGFCRRDVGWREIARD